MLDLIKIKAYYKKVLKLINFFDFLIIYYSKVMIINYYLYSINLVIMVIIIKINSNLVLITLAYFFLTKY